jgi:hypothetical protein
MGDVERAFAFVARRAGSRSLPAARWVHELSFGLHWLTPGAAKAWVASAKSVGLLRGEEPLELALDPATVDVPAAFRPNPDAVPAAPPAEDGFLSWVDKVAAATKRDRAAVLAEVHTVQDAHAGLLDADTAVWVLAARAGLDVRRAAAHGV